MWESIIDAIETDNEKALNLANKIDSEELDKKGNFGETALHWAAYIGDKKLCELLLSKMSLDTINAVDRHGYTALSAAQIGGHIDIECLIEQTIKQKELLNQLLNIEECPNFLVEFAAIAHALNGFDSIRSIIDNTSGLRAKLKELALSIITSGNVDESFITFFKKIGEYKLVNQLEKKQKYQKKEQKYQKVIKAEQALHQQAKDIQLQEQILQERIEAISDEDIVNTVVYNIGRLLNNLSYSIQNKESILSLRKLLNLESKILQQPEELIKPENTELFSRLFYTLGKQSKVFTLINSAIIQIKSIIESLVTLNNTLNDNCINLIQQELTKLGEFYNNYTEIIIKALPGEREAHYQKKILLQGGGMVAGKLELFYRYLNPDAAKTMLPKVKETDLLNKPTNQEAEVGNIKIPSDQSGTHFVPFMNGVYYKHKPTSPGVEFMVGSLGALIGGYVSPPTKLINIKKPSNNNKVFSIENFPFLASKEVFGTDLQYIIEQRSDYILDKLDLENFAAMVILSLITDPQDGKADNYYVEFDKNPITGEVINFRIIGIDNDIAFADPIVKLPHGSEAGKHLIHVKNILYFFPQMKDKINQTFREKFLKLIPEQIMIEWLSKLHDQNKLYQSYLDYNIFKLDDYEGKKIKDFKGTEIEKDYNEFGMRLPIKFKVGTTEKVYKKLMLIQEYMQNNSNLTYFELFLKIEKLVAEYYHAVQNNVHTRLLKKYDLKGKINLGDELMDCLHEVYKRDAKVLEDLVKFDEAWERGNTGYLTATILKTARLFDFVGKRNQSVGEAVEEFLTNVDFSKFSDERIENLIWDNISRHFSFIKKLELKNRAIIDDSKLVQLIDEEHFSKLEKIVLVGLGNISVKGILSLLKDWSNKLEDRSKTLVIEDCQNLSKNNWEDIAKAAGKAKIKFCVRIESHEFDLSKTGKDLLFESIENLLLKSIQSSNYVEKLYHYLKEYKNINFSELNEYGMSALHFAVAWNKSKIVEILINYGVNISDQNEKTGYSPLHYGARADYIGTMQILLEHSEKTLSLPLLERYISLKDNNNESALDKAVKHHHKSVAQLLVRYGANVDDMKQDKLNELLNSTDHSTIVESRDLSGNNNLGEIVLNGEIGEVYNFA